MSSFFENASDVADFIINPGSTLGELGALNAIENPTIREQLNPEAPVDQRLSKLSDLTGIDPENIGTALKLEKFYYAAENVVEIAKGTSPYSPMEILNFGKAGGGIQAAHKEIIQSAADRGVPGFEVVEFPDGRKGYVDASGIAHGNGVTVYGPYQRHEFDREDYGAERDMDNMDSAMDQAVDRQTQAIENTNLTAEDLDAAAMQSTVEREPEQSQPTEPSRGVAPAPSLSQ